MEVHGCKSTRFSHKKIESYAGIKKVAIFITTHIGYRKK